MKNLLKSTLFVMILIILYYFFSYLFLPKDNIGRFGLYKTSLYEILGEKPNTIDAVAIGDSLVYSSICPMEIYGNYGYTVFDCAEPAQIMADAYEYYKVALESQKPKIAFIESNILFRDANKNPWYNESFKVVKNSIPLILNHNNWKKMIFSDFGLVSEEKGYRSNKDVKPSENKNYMKASNKTKTIPDANIDYLEKIIKLSKEHNVKLVFVGLPSQKSWSYEKHKKMEEVSKEFGLEYINLNGNEDLKIDWTKDTKDRGDHLNFYGAKKVSKFIGEYLKNTDLLEDHREDPKYSELNELYQKHMEL